MEWSPRCVLSREGELVRCCVFSNPFTLKESVRFVGRNMSMKALVVEEFGDSSKQEYSETTKPVPAEGEVVSIKKLYKCISYDKN